MCCWQHSIRGQRIPSRGSHWGEAGRPEQGCSPPGGKGVQILRAVPADTGTARQHERAAGRRGDLQNGHTEAENGGSVLYKQAGRQATGRRAGGGARGARGMHRRRRPLLHTSRGHICAARVPGRSPPHTLPLVRFSVIGGKYHGPTVPAAGTAGPELQPLRRRWAGGTRLRCRPAAPQRLLLHPRPSPLLPLPRLPLPRRWHAALRRNRGQQAARHC